MEEIKNYENVAEEAVMVAEEVGRSGKGWLALGAVTLLGGAAVYAWTKSKEKRKARQIRKLEKEGYVIVRPEEAAGVEFESDYEVEE